MGSHVPEHGELGGLAVSALIPVEDGGGRPLSALARETKLDLLRRHGGIVLRGFTAGGDDFRALADELGHRFYNMALDPRIRELVSADGVVAGVLKGQGAVPCHMERGYSPLKPELIMFHVVTPSPVGGESLLCAGARVLEALAPATVARFRAKRLKYRHTWEPEAWRGRYGQTPDEVAARLRAQPGIVDFAFAGDLLHYSYVVPAIVRSRLGGADGFANNLVGAWQVQHAPPETRRAVHEHAVMFEDDEPVTAELVAEVEAAVAAVTETHALAAGDIIVLDNYRVMHGRAAFEGARVMHTVMADARF